ncbi:MAG: LacI family DNA-binding transcriptional regulator [Anaerolineae bacterium]|nr:LacI family DNA-binding transcriptional regulator [Anaerolineae bacterium]
MTYRKVTITDISRDAGVSKRTVSRVLNNSPLVSKTTRERVLASIRRLNYHPDIIARSLAGGKNRILGVFVYEPSFPLESPDFYYPFLLGIQAKATTLDYNLLLYTRRLGPEPQRSVYMEGVNMLRVADGSILLGVQTNHEDLRRLHEEEYPFVYIGRRDVPGCEIDHVTANYAEMTGYIVQYLFDKGHRRIAYVQPGTKREPDQDRFKGFLEGMEMLGLSADWVINVEEASQYWTLNSGWEGKCTPAQVAELRAQGVTAVITSNALWALSYLQAAEEAGVRVPEDMSLVALSDPLAPAFRRYPPLTYLSVPRREMGYAAVELLVNRLEGRVGRPQSRCLTCHLVEGATVRSIVE